MLIILLAQSVDAIGLFVTTTAIEVQSIKQLPYMLSPVQSKVTMPILKVSSHSSIILWLMGNSASNN